MSEDNGKKSPARQQQKLDAPSNGELAGHLANGEVGLEDAAPNRQRKSNGANGNSRSSRNSVKHDLFSRDLVFTSDPDKREFEELLRELFEDCDPQGARERELVLDLVYCRWRKRRLLRWELAELHRYWDQYKQTLRTELEQKFQMNLTSAKISGTPEYLKHSTHGLAHLLEVLQSVKSEVEKIGFLPPAVQEKLGNTFGTAEGSITQRCIAISNTAQEAAPTSSSSAAGSRQNILHVIEQELQHLQVLKEIASEAEARSIEVRETCLSRIPAHILDRMQRYETSVDRQFGRILDQLERLQNYRKGTQDGK